jgi:hypothetical protein
MILQLISTTTTEAIDILDNDAVTEVAETINKYGVVAVVLAVFICIVIGVIGYVLLENKKSSKEIINMMKKQNEIINAQNETLIKKLTETESNKKNEEKVERGLVDIFIKLDMAIKDYCKELQEDLKCDRVAIYVCHNGSKSNMGLPFFKTTCISEWRSKSKLMRSNLIAHSDIPLGMYYNAVKKLFINGYYIIKDRDSLKASDTAAYEQLVVLDSKSSIVVSIKAADGSQSGAVVVEFSEPIGDDVEKLNTYIEKIKELAEKTSPLLDFSKHENNALENDSEEKTNE